MHTTLLWPVCLLTLSNLDFTSVQYTQHVSENNYTLTDVAPPGLIIFHLSLKLLQFANLPMFTNWSD